MSLDTPLRPNLADIIGYLKGEGVTAVAIASQHIPITSLSLLQCRYQQHQGKGTASTTHLPEQCILNLCLDIKAESAPHFAMSPGIWTVVNSFGEIFGLKAYLLHQTGNRLRHNPEIALIVDKSVLPGSHKLLSLRSPEVNYLVGD